MMKQFIPFLLIGGVLCLGFGGCNLVVSQRWQEREPNIPRLTCDQILRQGPGTADLVIVTDVRPCTREPVYWSTGGGDIHIDEYFYLPVYPVGAAKEPENHEVAFLFFTTERDIGLKLIGHPAGTELLCTVGLGISELDSDTQELLASRYPGLRVRDCWLLTTHDDRSMSERAAQGYRAGIGFLVAGVLLITTAIVFWAITARSSDTPANHSG